MNTKLPDGSALIGQSGGPTAVINQSLAGCIEQLRRFKRVKKIYGMRHGVSGLVQDPPAVVDLGKVPTAKLARIARTPAAALGSSRDKPDAAYCERILSSCKKLNVRYFFYIGGNDSSDTCRIVSELAVQTGYDMRCFHVPKTVDNDLMENDHCPGFPSAARYVATAFMADSLDNASLPGVKINVVMGRHAGFLTAASALARGTVGGAKGRKAAHAPGPHLIYLPEVPFDRARFLRDVEGVYARLGRCQVAISEGVQDEQGRPVVTTLTESLARDAHGNIQLSGVGALGDALGELVKKELKTAGGKGVRVRGDTFGYLQRCWPDPSPVDAREARGAAVFAVRLAMAGHDSGSTAIVRTRNSPYAAGFKRIELSAVAGKTRTMPKEFIAGTSDVSGAFVKYCAPLVGMLPDVQTL